MGLRPLAGSNPAECIVVCLLCCVVCCQVEVSAMGRSFVRRGSNECGVSECDGGALTARGPCATRDCES